MNSVKKILIVEGESSAALNIKEQLSLQGYLVFDPLSTGEDVLNRINSLEPDLILMNIALKGRLDGIETAHAILNYLEIPIIYLTGDFNRKLLNRVKKNTPFSFLVKPFDVKDLLTAIEIILYKVDLAKKIKPEIDLKISEDRYKRLVEQSPLGISIFNSQGKITYMNQATKKFCGLKSKNQASFLEHGHIIEHNNLDKNGIIPLVKKAFSGDPDQSSTFRYEIQPDLRQKNKKRKKICLDQIVFPLKDDQNNILEVVLIQNGISEFKKTEKAHLITDHVTDIIWTANEQRKINFITPSVKNILGYDPGELINLNVLDLIAREDLEKAKSFFQHDNHSLCQPNTIELRHICKNKKLKWCEVSLSFLYEKELMTGLIGTIHDISARKKTELELEKTITKLNFSYKELKEKQDQLVQSGKLAALGTLASGIAHEISQPLMGISMGVELILFSAIGNDLKQAEVKKRCDDILSYLHRIKTTIEHIRVFSRDQRSDHFDCCDINDSIKNCLTLVREQLKNHDIQIKLRLNYKIPVIQGNLYKVEQIVLNLISNSKDALDEKESKIKKKFLKKITVTSFTTDQWVGLCIKDNGIGIQSKLKKRIFEPFYTTKPVNKGTGLGLSVTFGLIKEMKGEIKVNSRYGNYTEFRVLFPKLLHEERKENAIS